MIEYFDNDSPAIQRIIGQANYKKFLRSEKWKDLRTACLAHYFAGGIPLRCFVCGKPGRVSVHHLRYPALDPVADLVPVCGSCNYHVERFDPRVREQGLSATEFRRRMLREFKERRRLKRLYKELKQADANACRLVKLAGEEKARLQSWAAFVQRPEVDFLERLVPGYIRWLRRESLANHEDCATRFLEKLDDLEGTLDFSPLPMEVGEELDFNPCWTDPDQFEKDLDAWESTLPRMRD